MRRQRREARPTDPPHLGPARSAVDHGWQERHSSRRGAATVDQRCAHCVRRLHPLSRNHTPSAGMQTIEPANAVEPPTARRTLPVPP
jgi:hypothetical protein